MESSPDPKFTLGPPSYPEIIHSLTGSSPSSSPHSSIFSPPRVCEQCGAHPVDVFCSSCPLYLCSLCDNEIHCTRDFQSHARFSIAPPSSPSTTPGIFCPFHRSVPPESVQYCLTCHFPCCADCAVLPEHSGHSIVSATSQECLDDLRDSVQKVRKAARVAQVQAEQRRRDLAEVRREVGSALEEALTDIGARFRTLREALGAREAALKLEAAAAAASVVERLERQERASEEALQRAELVLGASERLPSDAGALVGVLCQLQEAGNSLTDVSRHGAAVSTPCLVLRGAERLDQCARAAATLGSVRAEMPPIQLTAAPAGGIWWNSLVVQWEVGPSGGACYGACGAFMRTHPDARFELQMCGADSGKTFRSVYTGPGKEFIARELQPETSYFFRVRLVLSNGERSPFSTVLALTTSSRPNLFVLADGAGHALDPSRMIATKTGKTRETWDTAITTTMPLRERTVHRWFVKLRALHGPTMSVFVGVAPPKSAQKAPHEAMTHGWFLYTGASSLWSGPPHNYKNTVLFGVKTLQPGDSVGVIFDSTGTTGTLSFFIPGLDWHVAYTNIPLDIQLAPTILLAEPNDCVEVALY